MTGPAGSGPFAALGLPARAGLTDAEVRAAWRRIAAATHPDRADGGDPGRFGQAAAAYQVLRTGTGRGEALADLTGPAQRPAGPLTWRVRRGRPARLALRAAGVIAAGAAVVTAAGIRPATLAVIVGMLTWLILTGRHDLAPPR